MNPTMTVGQKIGVGLFSILFVLIGTALLYGITIHPLLLARKARSWVPTQCQILTSVMRTDRSTQKPTYEAEVRFRYTFRSSTFISSTYTFASNYSSDRAAKERILAQYPSGKQTTCFVNRENPQQAILVRNRPSDLWFGLIGVPFLIVGLGFFGSVVTQLVKPLFVRTRTRTDDAQPPGLRIKRIRSGQGATVFLALFWNIFMALAIYMVASQWNTRPNYVVALILFVFAVVGIFLLASVITQLLSLLSPGIQLKVFGYRLGPGERFEISWTISRVPLLSRAEIWLKYGVHSVPVYISGSGRVPANGQTSVKIPEDMPTNDVVVLRFVGYLKRLPIMKQDYVVTV